MLVPCANPTPANPAMPVAPKRRGAPPKDYSHALVAADFLYLDLMNWLSEVREDQGAVPDWISGQGKWRGSLSELAFEIVRQEISQFRYIGWQRLRNLMSEMNRKYCDFS
jgi:hypothetical protein